MLVDFKKKNFSELKLQETYSRQSREFSLNPKGAQHPHTVMVWIKTLIKVMRIKNMIAN